MSVHRKKSNILLQRNWQIFYFKLSSLIVEIVPHKPTLSDLKNNEIVADFLKEIYL